MPEDPPKVPEEPERLASAAGPDALDHALADLAQEIRQRMPAAVGSADDEGFDAIALVDELRRRLGMLGMSERSGELDEFGFDRDLVERAEPLLRFLAERWWRLETRGLAELPEKGPALFVANRSGILPYDGLMISHTVARHDEALGRPRFLVADWLITLPFAQPTLARLGGVRACRENAERLLTGGRSVVAFPEGIKGAGKVFRDRYQLQRFGRGGVVRLALEAGVPLVPVSVVGAEEAHPMLFRIETLARAAGLPFVPVTPTFPWLGPLGAIPLPSKWSIRFGPAVATAEFGPDAARDEILISRLTENLRSDLQDMVDADLQARRGVFS